MQNRLATHTPLAAFSLATLGDLAQLATGNPVWYAFSFVWLGVGIFASLLNAVSVFLDLDDAEICRQARRITATRAVLNLGAVGLYVANLFVRSIDPNVAGGREGQIYLAAANLAALAALCVSAGLGGAFARGRASDRAQERFAAWRGKRLRERRRTPREIAGL